LHYKTNMAKRTQTNKPRIFISHAWEDKPLVRRLETELSAAGAEVWVDHLGIRGGDNLPERISDALEWCNTLLLLWSDSAGKSRWVKLEWSNALSLEKAIIPCQLGDTKLPAILAHTVYLDFRNFELGMAQLLHALKLARKSQMIAAPTQPVEQVAQAIHNRLHETVPPTKPKPPQTLLRSQPINVLAIAGVNKMLKQYDFCCHEYDWNKEWSNPHGKGLDNKFELQQIGQIVFDIATGLIWQQSGSPNYLPYTDAEEYIRDLNHNRFVGHSDWRLPTLEEAMSLMKPKRHGELYIDPIFDRKQSWIWTADKSSAGSAWYVDFNYGYCTFFDLVNDSFVRAVR